MDDAFAGLGPLATGLRPALKRLPIENISSIASGELGRADLIPLWFGEGDLPSPPFAAEAVARALAANQVFYTHQNGIPELREALATYLNGLHGTALGPDRITVTAGGMGAITLAIQLLVEPGDNVVIVDPVWPNIGGAVAAAGAIARKYEMRLEADGWNVDVDRLVATFDARTRAVFFASPGNPTGAMVPLPVQQAILEACRRRGIWVIADEVYNRMVFGVRSAPSLASVADPEDRLLVINSFSKSWAMTGWRLGWLVHPAALGRMVATLTQYSNSGQPTFLQHAAASVVREGEPWVAKVNAYAEQGMRIACDVLESLPRVRLHGRPKASMYAFFRVDGLPDSRAACRAILAKARVGLAPGAFFGTGSEGFLRLCYCRSPAQLGEAMERLAAFLR